MDRTFARERIAMSVIGKINIIIRLRINSDGEGVRTVVFLQGCPLSCLWCCNPETRFGERFAETSTEKLYELIARDRIYFDATGGGVTFSGGEPLWQGDYIKEFLQSYGHLFRCNIETSLFAPFETVEKLIPFIHEWYVDFKIFDEDLHMAYTGASNRVIKENLTRLAERIPKSRIIVTYPVITGLNDSTYNVDKMIAFMKELGLYRIELHPYRKDREEKHVGLGLTYDPIERLSPKTLDRIKEQLTDQGIEIIRREVKVERQKCDVLKGIRRAFCETHHLPLKIEDCPLKDRCIGTCPKCEEELDYINEWRNTQCLLWTE